MTSRKVKHHKNRKDSYTVTESIPLESVSEEFYPTEVMIISSGKPELLIADDIKVVGDTAPETQVAGADDSNCSSPVTSSFHFNPTESDDIDGAKEPLSSPDVSNAEYDTSAFGFDVKIEQVAVPFESQADQITSDSPEESPVIHEADCSDSSYNNATSFRISPANENEIKAARIRMEAYIAKRGSLMKTTTKVTSPNNMNQISQSQSDEVSGDVPVKDAPTTIARKIDPETTVADNLDKTSYDENCGQIRTTPICDQAAATSPVGCHTDPITIATESLAAPFKDTTSNPISPAKEDEIKTARIRMEAYLPKKGGSMKKPIVVPASNHFYRTAA